MLDPRRRWNRSTAVPLAAPGEDLTAVMLRFAASAVTLAVAVILTLVN